MRVLLVNIYFHPDPTGTGLMMTELAAGLAVRGHQVTVVTSFPHYGKSRLPPRYRGRFVERDWVDGVRVVRTFVHVSPRRDVRHRLLNYVSFGFSSAVMAVMAEPVDVVFACSPPLTTGVTGWLAAKAHGAPLVFNAQDIYPDVAVKLGVLTNRRVVRAMERMESFVYMRSAKVVVISEAGKRNLLAKGVGRERVVVIENWADVNALAQGDGARFRLRHGLDGKRVVMYSGNVGLVHGLRNVIDCAKVMRAERDVVFVIAGEGSAKKELVTYALENHVGNVRFLSTQSRETFPDALAAADMCLVTLGRGMSTSSVPSKAYGIMAAGRPMLAAVDEGSEVWELVQRSGCGVCVPPDDPGAMADAVRAMLNEAERLDAYGQAGRRYVRQHNARKAQIDRHEQVLRETVKGFVGGREERVHPVHSGAE